MSKVKRRDMLKVGLAAGTAGFLTGCKVLEAGANIGLQQVGFSEDQASSTIRAGKAIAKTFEDFTPEQEYYIGRTVAANICSKYDVINNFSQTEYVSLIGLQLAYSSDIPETFGGYHFAILNSESVNAFAAPGGFIFVTKGLLRCCPHEDALSAVLAHEIAHVQLKHGLKAIKSSRITDALKIVASEAASQMSGADFKNLVGLFGDCITDVTSTMIDKGYSRSAEYEADELAVTIMDQAGYLNKGMGDMLGEMGKRLKPGGTDFFKTHPSPKNRLDELTAKIDKSKSIPAVRTQRFRNKAGLA